MIILSKYGLADLFKEVKIDWVRKCIKSRRKELPNQFTKHQLIRMALSELGTTFIKLGQLLSTRSDLVGVELAEELSKLQSSTPADPFEYVEATILNEFQVSSLQDVFAEFNVEPMASASIAQVHRASLRTGEQIVVKVMHEGIIEKVKSDLEIIAQLANMAEQFISPLKIYQPVATVRELKNTILNELDFRKELSNMQVLADNFANNPGIHIPVPVVELSGRKILSMEFVK
ncbi:MAG: AarF/UbiB family protein, partial [Cytophagales bacterium]|nr:AarF/UbiB family protein [Cytophagales bacterium]